MKKHKWIKEDGEIDIFAYESGSYHNGPRCSVCNFCFCHHCDPEGYNTNCPSHSLDANDSKLDRSLNGMIELIKQPINP